MKEKKEQKRKYYQQGDVLIHPCDSIPAGAKFLGKRDRFTLAEGEATGHYHEIEGDLEMFEHEGVMYMKVVEPSETTHQEHKKIPVEPGIYEIGIVVEVNPETKNVENVKD